MRFSCICMFCDVDDAMFDGELELHGSSVYELRCPKGHVVRVQLLMHDFQKLFEVALNAVVDKYYREAVGSFAASHERFMEFVVRNVYRSRRVGAAPVEASWRSLAKQSERQLGAFVALYTLEFNASPQLLPEKMVQLRNRVVHQGYFPTRQEACLYGEAVLTFIRREIERLKSSPIHRDELIRSVNARGDYGPGSPSVTFLPWSVVSTNHSFDAPASIESALASVSAGRGGPPVPSA